MTRFLLSAAIIIGLPVSALAQGAGETAVEPEIAVMGDEPRIQVVAPAEILPVTPYPQGSTDQVLQLENFVYDISETEGVVDVFYSDMSGDGQAEALVIMDDCDASAICSWRLYASRDGNIALVGGDRGRDIRFSGTAGGGAVVWADGVTWAFSGGTSYPFGSLLDVMEPTRGMASDVAAINDQDMFEVRGEANVALYSADFLPELPGIERFYQVGGLENNYGDSGYPHALVDEDGRLLSYGLSLDIPSLFAAPDGGLTMITNGPAGYSAITVPPGGEMDAGADAPPQEETAATE